MADNRNVLRPLDADAIRLAKTLVRTARHGTMATLDPTDGRPVATRVGLTSDSDGTPVILVSALSAHTPALRADPRCSLLIGEPARGDPLAHPRITLACKARPIGKDTAEESRIAGRYLAHQPKAQLYANLPDFSYFRLEIGAGSLNAGFGKAFALTPADILTASAAEAELADAEPSALEHMNTDHAEAVTLIARVFSGAPDRHWRLTGIDAEGIDLADGDDMRRVFFEVALTSSEDLHRTLVRMSGEARRRLPG